MLWEYRPPPRSRAALFRKLALALAGAALAACSKGPSKTAAAQPEAYALEISAVDTRFQTRDHFMASIEMQFSGEPFAEAMGRDLAGFNRDYSCQVQVCAPDVYSVPGPNPNAPSESRLDVAGYSSAIESYEYSKQPMNQVAFESGAGTSLLYGPVLNPGGEGGDAALEPLQKWLVHLANASAIAGRVVISADHPLGWPGFWPTLQPFASYDPAIEPTHEGGCSLTSDDNRGVHAALTSNAYECDYTTLHLPDRDAQVDKTIEPGASGFSDWKQALWALNYLQVMHDLHESAITRVPEGLLQDVGLPGNTLGSTTGAGTYLGSSNIEGFQAGTFIEILDNQADQWLRELTTTDGQSLSGFANLRDALEYGPQAPLRWLPASISVHEVDDPSGFPRPDSYSIAAAQSRLLGLAGLLGAYASVYALTDYANPEVGGSQAARVYFDGDPFPQQNQTPSGEDSLHDRALAMMRLAVVDIDRMHFDDARGLLADEAMVKAGEVERGERLSSDVAAYTLLSLRTARRALDSQLSLYGNTKPDTHGIPTPLDAFALDGDAAFGQRLDRLIDALSELFYAKLTTPQGRAFGSWDLAHDAAGDDGTSLDAHTAAIRGLLTAYLATGAIRYRQRAERVWQRLDDVFYDRAARIYRPREADHGLEVTFTPRRFGLLQAALRETYEQIGLLPGNSALRGRIEARVARLNTLVLNGWDDRNRDGKVDWPDECAHLGTGPDGEPLGLGGLQLAERTLTGDTGALPPAGDSDERVRATDRDHDCVPEISAVGLPAALASSITFRLKPMAAPPPPSDAGAEALDAGWVGDAGALQP